MHCGPSVPNTPRGPTCLILTHGALRVNIEGANYDLGGTQDAGGNKATGAGDYDYYVNFCQGITKLPGASCSCVLGDASHTGASHTGALGNDALRFRNPC